MRALIMDFGLMRDVQVEDDTRVLAGTPAYIAPELVDGIAGASRSHLVDIYSMGTTAYELLTGSIPFTGKSWIEILQKHITEIPTPPSVRRAGIPEELDDIILLAMSKDPRERFQSCNEFIDTLLEFERSPRSRGRMLSLMPPPRPSTPGLRRKRASDPADAPRRTPRSARSTPGRTGSAGRGSAGARSTPGKTRSSHRSSGKRGQLLVADPDPEFRKLVEEAAKSAVPNCRVHAARHGAEALNLVDEIRPHVLVLDLALPQVNGLEVAASVVGDEENSHTRIIVVTDKGGDLEAGILEEMGVRYFLTKPVDVKELANLLRPPLEAPLALSNPPE
jgi:CheY-like chemotaxis protein